MRGGRRRGFRRKPRDDIHVMSTTITTREQLCCHACIFGCQRSDADHRAVAVRVAQAMEDQKIGRTLTFAVVSHIIKAQDFDLGEDVGTVAARLKACLCQGVLDSRHLIEVGEQGRPCGR